LELIISGTENVIVDLEPVSIMQQEVIVYGSDRGPKRIMDAATSIEKISLNEIRAAPSNYYDRAIFKKGVDVTTSSMTFKTFSTRGFNYSGSARVNQLVDGMDNQAPGLNFPIGNFTGLTELDVENIEILPGASSALYGPGGMNGTILITSKNPFKYQGLSILVKEGVNHVGKSNRGSAEPYHDFSMRYAKAFKEKISFKIAAQYVRATDWLASDTSNYKRIGSGGLVIPGNRNTDPNYDGVNVYGDETTVNIQPFLAFFLPPGHPLIEPISVSRTGYYEHEMVDPETKNIKLSAGLHYKINNKIEALLSGNWGTGNTVYTGNNRYVLKGITIGQYKIELKHPNWFLRGFTTQEDAGEAYSATIAAQFLNEAWKRSYDSQDATNSWYPQFTGAYVQARLAGADKQTALNMARSYADRERPSAGSNQFNQLFELIRKIPIPNGGLFKENSQLWMGEGQYNFSNLKFIELIVGANYKKYMLDSDGTIFIDTAGAISFNEIGMYAQASKKLFSERLTLSFSGRMDKNEDFKEQFTPRITALVKVAEDNNLRFSYQTAYRFPTTLYKYVRLNVGDYELLGGLPWIKDYMQMDKYPVFEIGENGPSTTPYTYTEFKPEKMTSYELGYRGLISNKILVDAYGYWGRYKNFLGRNVLIQPATGKVFATGINSPTKVKSYGFGLGLDYQFIRNFNGFFNVYSDVITDVPTGFQSYFNTPKYRVNLGISHSGIGKQERLGFAAMMRWQDDFYGEGELANGQVESFTSVDAQISYRLPKIKSTFRIGGTNIFNKYYKNGFANPEIGGLYYVAYAFNL
jgi:outer membrane receptor protein involved in Fe transport